MAGLAVLGVKPMQAATQFVLETPNGNISARQLTGEELEAAINEATTSSHYGKFLSFIMNRGCVESRSQASATLIESEGNEVDKRLGFVRDDRNDSCWGCYYVLS